GRSPTLANRAGRWQRPPLPHHDPRSSLTPMSRPSPLVIAHAAAPVVDLGSFGARFLLSGRHTGQAFSLVEHPVPPRTLAAPLHRHSREDEYSIVLEGTLTVQLGEEIVTARAGDVVCKPRGQFHTFWNATDAPCRFLELV